jgi:hypothetical protein
MPVGWFLAQYAATPGKPNARYCAINEHADAIYADGGAYDYREVLGGQAVVKVGGVTVATLQALVADPLIRRFAGVNNLGDSLAALTAAQWTGYRDYALSLGYPASEWDAAFPLAKESYTLRDVIRFLMRRRREGRFDAATQSVILDGQVVSPGDADQLDGSLTAT